MDKWISEIFEDLGIDDESQMVERYRDVKKRYEDELVMVHLSSLRAAVEHDRQVVDSLLHSIQVSLSSFHNDVRFDAIPQVKEMVVGMFMALVAVADRKPTTNIVIGRILDVQDSSDESGAGG